MADSQRYSKNLYLIINVKDFNVFLALKQFKWRVTDITNTVHIIGQNLFLESIIS